MTTQKTKRRVPSIQGQRHPKSKLNVDVVRMIRSIEGISQRAMAKMCGVTQKTISEIKSRKTWNWLDEDQAQAA